MHFLKKSAQNIGTKEKKQIIYKPLKNTVKYYVIQVYVKKAVATRFVLFLNLICIMQTLGEFFIIKFVCFLILCENLIPGNYLKAKNNQNMM